MRAPRARRAALVATALRLPRGRVPRRRAATSCDEPPEQAVESTMAALAAHPGLVRAVMRRAPDDEKLKLVRQIIASPEAQELAFQKLDINGDGTISREEIRSKFKKLDLDGDGIITREEWRARWTSKCRGGRSVQPERDPSRTTSGAPTAKQLRLLALSAGLPFVGFGFMDNFIMIVAGDSIDRTFGAALGLSSIAAAGLGNMVSDVCGIGAGGWIERMATRLGVPSPGLSAAQLQSTVAQRVTLLATSAGIAIGCLLGLLPLLVLEDGGPLIDKLPAETEKQILRAFRQIDVDCNGVIDRRELSVAFRTFGGSKLEKHTLDQLFAEFDVDKDGTLTFDEFKLVVQKWVSKVDP